MAGRTFNKHLKEGLIEQLVFAPLYIVENEAPAVVDDPDVNQEAAEEDHVDGFGADEEESEEAGADSAPEN